MPGPRQPVLFVSHGAPTLAVDRVRGADFARLAAQLPRPRALLVLSAHWLDAPATLGTTTSRPLLYDFAGFPAGLYALRYEAAAAADLAGDLRARLPHLRSRPERPWDHGVWVPLLHMYPRADVPVLQLSVPYRSAPRELFALGQQLAALRDEGVLVMASGGAVHNLGGLDWRGGSAPPAWATDFEAWLRTTLQANDVDALLDYRRRAPGLALAHPTDDHFVPLLVALGAAASAQGPVQFPIEGFEFGSLSRLAVQWG